MIGSSDQLRTTIYHIIGGAPRSCASQHMCVFDFRLGSKSEKLHASIYFRCSPNNGHRQDTSACPFRAHKRKWSVSFDDFVGTGKQRWWKVEAEQSGGLEVEDQIVFRRLLHW